MMNYVLLYATLTDVSSYKLNVWVEKGIDSITVLGPRILGALLVWIIGAWVIKLFLKGIKKAFDRSKIDETLKLFLQTIIKTLFKILLAITVLGMLGIEMTSFIAILGAVGLAIGMSLSGALQNFTGGIIILIFKPYKVGDFIEAQGYMGTVREIQIFNTILLSPDNKTIIIPNGGLSTSSLTNYSKQEQRRVDWKFGMAYGDDVDKTRETIRTLIAEDKRILLEPEPLIVVSELGDSSVNFVVRVWVQSVDYWSVFFDMNEKVYKKFKNVGINIPFPQMDVHVHNS